MLKKPHNYVTSVGDNNYYLLNANGDVLVTIESVVKYKTLFRRTREFTQGLKLMPLGSPLLYTFVEMTKLGVIGESDKEGLEREVYYDEVNVKSIRRKLKRLVDSIDEGGAGAKYNYSKTSTNPIFKEIINKGTDLLCIEELGSFARYLWLAGSDRYGTLTVHRLLETGRPSKSKIVGFETFVFDIDLVNKIMIKLEGER